MPEHGIVLYLHVHQPFRMRPYSVFDMANNHDYFGYLDGQKNQKILKKVSYKSYIPMNNLLLDLLKKYNNFKLSLSITGTVIEQMENWDQEALESFKKLVNTGKVEIVAETYYHSLAFFYSRDEFEKQVKMHQQKIYDVFHAKTSVFRNTELSYNNDLAAWADKAGFSGILTEGWDPILGWRSPNYIYRPVGTKQIVLLMKNYHLSDDLAFRFSDHNWSEWPLTVDKYDAWVEKSLENQPILNLFMDYETFGEHQWKESGIFTFFHDFVDKWLSKKSNTFYTVSEAINNFAPIDKIDIPRTITWADSERDLSAWLGNDMQKEAIKQLYNIENEVINSNDLGIIADWRKLQTSDHFYYMCTKWFNDGDVHAYFNPYSSPYDCFVYFMNCLRDLKWRISKKD